VFSKTMDPDGCHWLWDLSGSFRKRDSVPEFATVTTGWCVLYRWARIARKGGRFGAIGRLERRSLSVRFRQGRSARGGKEVVSGTFRASGSAGRSGCWSVDMLGAGRRSVGVGGDGRRARVNGTRGRDYTPGVGIKGLAWFSIYESRGFDAR